MSNLIAKKLTPLKIMTVQYKQMNQKMLIKIDTSL